jgi:hypothetical protein
MLGLLLASGNVVIDLLAEIFDRTNSAISLG